MRLIAIGDIHGDFDKLLAVVDSVQPTQDDTVVFLGDYIDRGPKIVETLDYIIDFKERFPNTVLLQGNHEEMMFDAKYSDYDDYDALQMWYRNGGDETLQQVMEAGKQISYYAEWLFRNTEMFKVIETEYNTYYFSHAGWDVHKYLAHQVEKPDYGTLIWSRKHVMFPKIAEKNWIDGIAVFGHTPLEQPYITDWGIGLDTGAVFGNFLTAAELPTKINGKLCIHTSH